MTDLAADAVAPSLEDIRTRVLDEASKLSGGARRSGMFRWCRDNGVNRSHANEFINGKRLPTTDLLNALGLEWRITPKRVEEQPHGD